MNLWENLNVPGTFKDEMIEEIMKYPGKFKHELEQTYPTLHNLFLF